MTTENTEMNTVISKRLMNRVVDYVHNERELEKLQKEWLVENIYCIYHKECPEGYRNTRIADLLDELKAEGIPYDVKTEGFGNNAKQYYVVHLQHLDLQVSKSVGWSRDKGDYNSIYTHLFGHYSSVSFTWVLPADAVRFLRRIDDLIPKWTETEWPRILLEAQKKAKMRSMSENTIQTMVTMKMKDAGIPYAFICQKQRVKVMFDMGHNTQMEVAVSHKKFMEQIDKVIQNAKAVKQLMDDSDIAISMKKFDNYLTWHE